MKKIYCDGASKGNPGRGGWGVWVMDGNIELFGHNPHTSNNQMEILAAVKAAEQVSPGETAFIYTDSKYVIDGITKWISNWKKNGWKTANKEPVKNLELWKSLDTENTGKKIQWTWVKGHSGDLGNEKADQLANRGAAGENSPLVKSAPVVKELDKKIARQIMLPLINDILKSQNGDLFIVLSLDESVEGAASVYHRLAHLTTGQVVMVSSENIQTSFVLEKADGKSLKSALKQLTLNVATATQNLMSLKKNCTHQVVAKDESAVCDICNYHFGWFCPDSPDHTCHYFSDGVGFVKLINETTVPNPSPGNEAYESDDDCLFCHEPDERK